MPSWELCDIGGMLVEGRNSNAETTGASVHIHPSSLRCYEGVIKASFKHALGEGDFGADSSPGLKLTQIQSCWVLMVWQGEKQRGFGCGIPGGHAAAIPLLLPDLVRN